MHALAILNEAFFATSETAEQILSSVYNHARIPVFEIHATVARPWQIYTPALAFLTVDRNISFVCPCTLGKWRSRMSEIPFSQRLSCSVTEAMQVTGLSRTTINVEMKAGRIASTRVAGRRLIFVRSLLDFLKSGIEAANQEAVAA